MNILNKLLLTSALMLSTAFAGGFDFMSPDNLYKTDLVRKALVEVGAQSIKFTTPDNIQLAAFYLKRADATATMIVVPGFLGIKESYAAFVQHFPKYNILLIDQRGRGDSGGVRWWKSVLSYGTHDYLDIVGAINYLHTNNKLPIIVYGSCAGAFNAARALIQMHKDGLIEKMNIKGLVFESGWHSVSNAGISAALGDISSNILYYIGPNKGSAATTPRQALDLRRATKLFNVPYQLCKEALHLLCWAVGDQIGQLDEKLDIFKDLRLLSIPIFFIHAEDDHYIPMQSAYLLSKTVKNSQCWWIGPGASWHVRHHCYLGKEFETRVNGFCAQVLKR
jgi:pimeloyl-ACP methyl ester carboxylesterase